MDEAERLRADNVRLAGTLEELLRAARAYRRDPATHGPWLDSAMADADGLLYQPLDPEEAP